MVFEVEQAVTTVLGSASHDVVQELRVTGIPVAFKNNFYYTKLSLC